MVIDMHGEAVRPSSVSAPLNSHFRQPWASEPHGTLQALEATPEGRFSSKTCLMRSGSEQVSPGLSTASPAGAKTDREDSFLSFIFKPWRLWLPLLKSCLCAPRFFTSLFTPELLCRSENYLFQPILVEKPPGLARGLSSATRRWSGREGGCSSGRAGRTLAVLAGWNCWLTASRVIWRIRGGSRQQNSFRNVGDEGNSAAFQVSVA